MGLSTQNNHIHAAPCPSCPPYASIAADPIDNEFAIERMRSIVFAWDIG